MKQVVLVFLGSGVGGSLRYLIGKYLKTSSESGMPWGTFTVNLLGSLLIGIILGLALKNNTLSQNQTLLLATGFCGGFTTFSAFANEGFQLLKDGQAPLFFLYVIGSIVIGLLAVWLGYALIEKLY